MKNVLIIGCGYLGMKVATLLGKRKCHVTATTRHSERLHELSKVAQKGVIFKGTREEELTHLIQANDLIIVTAAAGKRELYDSAYLHVAQMIKQIAMTTKSPKWLLYTSSTSVYGDHHGLWVDETSALLAQSPQGKCLIDTENCYLSLHEQGWHVTLFRVAELYGPGRELSTRFQSSSGKAPASGKEHFTNMIHLDDCAAAVDHAIKHRLEGIFNVADDDHPTREELYSQISEKLGLPKMEWDKTLAAFHTDNKRVSNHKLKATGFSFEHPHRQLN